MLRDVSLALSLKVTAGAGAGAGAGRMLLRLDLIKSRLCYVLPVESTSSYAQFIPAVGASRCIACIEFESHGGGGGGGGRGADASSPGLDQKQAVLRTTGREYELVRTIHTGGRCFAMYRLH